ncbi:HAD family phosphatase [Candidatus Pacearchaeota archaeon]|nr:HAD family phosphatase [Candidatus Pacearchaeota archaeon]
MKQIKAIIFDIGGVIYLGEQKSNAYMQEKLKFDEDFWFGAVKNIWNDLCIGKRKEEEGIAEMAKNLGLGKKKLKDLWIRCFKERFILNKPLLKIIEKLKKNYKTAILSDQWILPYKILITKRLKEIFDVEIYSHEAKIRKPNLKIYKITLKKLGLCANECIFIDDLDYNLKPAEELGMNTILFKDNKQLLRELKKFGVEI